MAICMADGQMVKRGSRELCHAASSMACNKCFPDLRPEFVTLRRSRLLAALGECDVFAFPSEFIAERYVDWGLPQEKCVVIANGQANLGIGAEPGHHEHRSPSTSVDRGAIELSPIFGDGLIGQAAAIVG